MTPSHRQEGCTGFPIEILEEVPEGEDIIDHEDLWIKYVDPELNGLPGNTNKSAIHKTLRPPRQENEVSTSMYFGRDERYL